MDRQTSQSKYTLHDRLFKEFLTRFLAEFMELFFPEEAARLDFSTAHFFDKELIINLPGQKLRITDVVVEIESYAGEKEIIIIHIEVEANDKVTLPKRLFEYYGLIRLLNQKAVLPIALVLLPNASNDENVGPVGWQTYQEELWGRTIATLQYGQVGLRDLNSRDFLDLNDPVAATLAALMKHEPDELADMKLQSLLTIAESSLGDNDKLFLVEIIQTYMPGETIFSAEEAIMQKLVDTELSWRERIEKEVFEEGVEREKTNIGAMIQQVLQTRFQTIPSEIYELFELCSLDQLNTLFNLALTSLTLNDFQNKLKEFTYEEDEKIRVESTRATTLRETIQRILNHRFQPDEPMTTQLSERLSNVVIESELDSLVDLALALPDLASFVRYLPMLDDKTGD